MRAYSEDLRRKIIELIECGASKAGAARIFGVSLSSAKRYARMAQEEWTLASRKGSGCPPKIDETAEKLLEEGVQERPAATVSDRRRFLERLMG
jgi:transposase